MFETKRYGYSNAVVRERLEGVPTKDVEVTFTGEHKPISLIIGAPGWRPVKGSNGETIGWVGNPLGTTFTEIVGLPPVPEKPFDFDVYNGLKKK